MGLNNAIMGFAGPGRQKAAPPDPERQRPAMSPGADQVPPEPGSRQGYGRKVGGLPPYGHWLA